MSSPIRIVNTVAPMRICDNGGWTDTWFAERGRIFNIAVYPYAEVQMKVFPNDGSRERVVVHAENYGERFVVGMEEPGIYDKHPLLEAAIEMMGVPEDLAIEVNIYSEAPGGCSTGTSAAVTVALIGALDRLTPGTMTPHQVARTAHAIETEKLKQQCGVQDQLCSAYGGICYIEIERYPQAVVSQLHVPNSIWWELERRLVLIFAGKAHSSSKVHEKVIRDLEGEGPDAPRLEALRRTADKAKDALLTGDFLALGKSMIENTEAQANLHPDLVSADAHRIIEIAREHGAVGWKVNGAGGDGGSVSILCGPEAASKRAMISRIKEENPLFQSIPIYLSRMGLRVWETPVPEAT